MPSPFPGMDPYLEAPRRWPGVHTNLITTLQAQLVPRLRPRYAVDVERRVYILSEDDPARRAIVPDLAVLSEQAGHRLPVSAQSGAHAGALLLVAMEDMEVREPRLVIREARSETLVAVMEVLSPANKTPGSRGREEYLAKRREVLHSSVHLVEIDLLREGSRVPTIDPIPPCDYCVHVSRASMRPRGEFFVFTVRDRLPSIPVPLRDGEEVALDLGETLRTTYDRAGYDLQVDYAKPADPPLRLEDDGWARSLVERARQG